MFKSDQEPAILALKQAVRESMHTVEFVMEESPVMKSAVEERIKCEVPSRHPILAFLVEHAGRLMSRY